MKTMGMNFPTNQQTTEVWNCNTHGKKKLIWKKKEFSRKILESMKAFVYSQLTMEKELSAIAGSYFKFMRKIPSKFFRSVAAGFSMLQTLYKQEDRLSLGARYSIYI